MPTTHTTSQCYSLKEIEKARRTSNESNKDTGTNRNANADPALGDDHGSLHTFIGVDNRRKKKILARAVAINSVVADVTRYLPWSEKSITWSRANHANKIEYPVRVALIVKPKVADYWLSKTLVDGGSTINILYLDTFRHLKLSQSAIEPTKPTFHDIVLAERPIRWARSSCRLPSVH
jgi:hypothetical protein